MAKITLSFGRIWPIYDVIRKQRYCGRVRVGTDMAWYEAE